MFLCCLYQYNRRIDTNNIELKIMLIISENTKMFELFYLELRSLILYHDWVRGGGGQYGHNCIFRLVDVFIALRDCLHPEHTVKWSKLYARGLFCKL